MKTFKTIFLALAITFSFAACEFKSPTEGFKVEGSIANFQDYSSNRIMAIVPDGRNFNAKISESKFENNYFSMFLPYELKNNYCNIITTDNFILFDSLIISSRNIKIGKVVFNSDNNFYSDGDVTQFGYTEKYNNGVADVTLVKTKYVYAQSAMAIAGEYETRLMHVFGEDLYKTVKTNLRLQNGWNIIYYIGNYTSKPNTYYWEVDTAIINIIAEKPENIELKWYYGFKGNFRDILRDNNAQFMAMPYIGSYYPDFIVNF